MLLAVMVSGCGHREITAVAPRLTPTADTIGVRSTTDRVARIPIAATSRSEAKTVTIRLRPVSRRPPVLFLIDGEPLGRRTDGSIDRVAVERALQALDPRRIESIEVVRDDEAVRRYGPDARDGAVLIVTRPDASRARARTP